MKKYTFATDPIANPASVISGPHYRFTVISDMVLRYEWSASGHFEDRASTFAINRNFLKPEFIVKEDDLELQIITKSLHLTYNKQSFTANGLHASFKNKMNDWGAEWRFGSPPWSNLGGTARTLDDVDGRCDMGTGILSKVGFSVLDDSDTMLFDGDGWVAPRKTDENIDGYLFSYGADFKGAIKAFYAISGRQPSVPRWCLGNWWSRYYAYTADEYLGLMEKFRENQIPLSVAVIDMDWHIVEGEQISHTGWTGYTWNRDLIPKPEEFLGLLHKRNLKTTLNDHPHSGVHKFEEVYEEMATFLGHNTSNDAPIPFDPTSSKFMNAYFSFLHGKFEQQGIDFWWIDWQQGRSSKIPGIDPLWVLNHFQYTHHKIQRPHGESPIIFSRYGGPGSHRYPVGFSGDSVATWESLAFQPEFTATASNIGYGWWSHDIGGHQFGYRDDELAVRWVQLGVFSPLLRLHSSRSNWMSKEPWRYRSEGEHAMRKALQLRHRLVPYIFSTTNNELRTEEPLVQPMYWGFPAEAVSYRFPNQYFFGESLIVNPVVSPRNQQTNRAKTRVWVPPGRHVDIMAGFVYDGHREIETYRSLDNTPVLARMGSIIPLDGSAVPVNGCCNPDSFEIVVVIGHNAVFDIVENTKYDWAAGSTDEARKIPIKYDQETGRLTATASGRSWRFTFISFIAPTDSIKVLIDDEISQDSTVSCTTYPSKTATTVTVPKPESGSSVISIELGSDPQLSLIDYRTQIKDMLEDFQVENATKDRLWEIMGGEQPAVVQVSQLLAMSLHSDVVGPFLEILCSDSR
ncbi:glycoside hydrolase, partial [Sarocladium strictum]